MDHLNKKSHTETPEERLWKMPIFKQVNVLKKIFSEKDLIRFNFFQVQETTPSTRYEKTTQKELENPKIGEEAIRYIRKNGLLEKHRDELKEILHM